MKCWSRNPAKSPGSIENFLGIFLIFLEITHTCPLDLQLNGFINHVLSNICCQTSVKHFGGKTGDGGGKGAKVTAKT